MTHPAWLDDLMLPVEAVLDLHQFLEVILKNNTKGYKEKLKHCNITATPEALSRRVSHPLFHDIVGVVGYFLHDAESSCEDQTVCR